MILRHSVDNSICIYKRELSSRGIHLIVKTWVTCPTILGELTNNLGELNNLSGWVGHNLGELVFGSVGFWGELSDILNICNVLILLKK